MVFNLWAIFLLTGSLVFSVSASDWSYPNTNPNGVLASVEHWGGECDTGRRQSPVDLAFDASVKGSFPSFSFRNYVVPISDAKVTNTGHSVQINNAVPSDVTVSGGGLPGSYMFDQMHFHWASEHTINERRYGLELHLVHHESRFKTLGEAASTRAGIAVIGVLFHVTNDDNEMLDIILRSTESSNIQVGQSAPLMGVLSPVDLLPKNRTTYFRYDGSLTTPGCGEAVVWTVFTESLPISMKQIERFKAIQTADGHELTHNYRSLQPLNSRPLVYVTEDNSVYKSSGISCHPAKFTVFFALLGLLGMFGVQSRFML